MPPLSSKRLKWRKPQIIWSRQRDPHGTNPESAHWLYVSCSVLSDSLPMDCSPQVLWHGILQAGILEELAIPFFQGIFQTRDQTQVLYFAGRFFTILATGEPSWVSPMLGAWKVCIPTQGIWWEFYSNQFKAGFTDIKIRMCTGSVLL